MNLSGKMAVFAACVFMPVSTYAVEMRDDLSFITGRYASPENCKKLQAIDRKGGPKTIADYFWHLTPQGFSDGWEASCQFHVVFQRDRTATAQSICVEGAHTSIDWKYFELHESKTSHPDLIIYPGSEGGGDSSMGESYVYCEKMGK
ncbi:MAG: hypothetical protein COC23_00130 [Hyphomicrobiales bacterium]|nr:MAG: hypothetical protein COC23_00130 [Hyphomicrobiales bacterium]